MRKLPTSIQVLGQTITVEHVDNLAVTGDRFGDWTANKNLIRVQSLGHGVPADACWATFFHEQLHCALELTGHSELSADEGFVERLAQCLYHCEKSRSFD